MHICKSISTIDYTNLRLFLKVIIFSPFINRHLHQKINSIQKYFYLSNSLLSRGAMAPFSASEVSQKITVTKSVPIFSALVKKENRKQPQDVHGKLFRREKLNFCNNSTALQYFLAILQSFYCCVFVRIEVPIFTA